MFEGLRGHVKMEIAGATRTAVYEVRDGLVRVISEFGEKVAEIGSMAVHPEYIARFLLEDLVREAGGSEE